jgi:hypothetical protein
VGEEEQPTVEPDEGRKVRKLEGKILGMTLSMKDGDINGDNLNLTVI